jgi:hypothetical protein
MRGFEQIYGALRAELAKRDAEPVLHLDGAWEFSAALELELTRDGVTPHVHDDERWVLGTRPPSAARARRPLHVWAGLPAERPRFAACAAPIAEALAHRIASASATRRSRSRGSARERRLQAQRSDTRIAGAVWVLATRLGTSGG